MTKMFDFMCEITRILIYNYFCFLSYRTQKSLSFYPENKNIVLLLFEYSCNAKVSFVDNVEVKKVETYSTVMLVLLYV